MFLYMNQNAKKQILFLLKVILRAFLRYDNMGIIDQDKNGIEVERNLFDRILKYTGVFGSVQALSILVSLVLTKVKSVLLGPAGYGITESLNRTVDLVRNSTNLGVATVAVPEISHSAGDPESGTLAEKVMLTRSWALLTAVLGMLVCLMLAPLLSSWAFDGDKDYALNFIILSLAVAAAAVTGGETAILRGTGMLRQIALSQLLGGILSLCISVPLYWFFNIRGIVPALTLSALGSMAVTCFYSCRAFPYRACPFSWSFLKKGTGMVGFGIFLTIAAFMNAWAWSFVARYLMGQGGSELTGAYSAGYMLVTYLNTLLLSVTDSEYYPRLSASSDDPAQAHAIMNNQALAMCMLAAPLVIIFMVCVPIFVFLVLEYDKFHLSISLAQMAVIGLFFKAVYQPIAYMVLARSDSKIYLLQETLCCILLIVCVLAGYTWGGMRGLGVSFAVWELSYLVIVVIVGRVRYGFVMSSKLVRNFLIQGVLVAVTAAGVLYGSIWGMVLCIAAGLASILLSLRFFSRHTTLLPKIISRLFHVFS